MSFGHNTLNAQHRNDIENRVRQVESELKDMGIRVNNINYTTKAIPDYMQYDTISSPYSRKIMTEFNDTISYEARYNIEISQGIAEDFINMTEKVEFFQKQSKQDALQADQLRHQVKKFEELKRNLHQTLNDNPGVKDQWDEIMVLMKLAGFDTKIV